MKLGIFLEAKSPRKAGHAFRVAAASRRAGNEVMVFLMGEPGECDPLTHSPQEAAHLAGEFSAAGGQILSCAACVNQQCRQEGRACPETDLAKCVNMVYWSDRTMVF